MKRRNKLSEFIEVRRVYDNFYNHYYTVDFVNYRSKLKAVYENDSLDYTYDVVYLSDCKLSIKFGTQLEAECFVERVKKDRNKEQKEKINSSVLLQYPYLRHNEE